jgi:imidazolonepropionase
MMWDSIWINANIVTQSEAGIIAQGAIGVQDGKITFIDDMNRLSDQPENFAREVHDVGGKLVTPGLIDCHTHLVYGGNRAGEFEQRLNGVSYAEIAQAGGGIASTMHATRAASEDDLFQAALPRLQNLMAEGVTGIEIKSGYGLDRQSEAKMLRVATRLRDHCSIDVQRTFLGAHALPPEYKDRPDEYIDLICHDMMPALHAEHLIDAVDAFCEKIGFTPVQTKRVFDKAKELGLPIKLHAEQLSNQNGAKLAASYKALSADHLEYLEEDAVKDMADAGTIAVLLPGAFYFLRETKLPPLDLLRRYKVPIAIATDHNPGSSPVHSLLLMMNMACTFFHMTPEETLAAVTKNAAQALGWQHCGILAENMDATFAVFDVNQAADLSYNIGLNPCRQVIVKGKAH